VPATAVIVTPYGAAATRAGEVGEMVVARQARPLARRYALLLALAVVPMLLLLVGSAWQQFGAQRRAELDTLTQAARERRLALDAALAPMRDHVSALRGMAEDRLAGLEPRGPSPWRGLLRVREGRGTGPAGPAVSLDHLAGTPLASRLGQVFGTPALLDRPPEAAAELDAALDLFEPMRLRHQATPRLTLSYYFSARRDLIAIFPFAPEADLLGAATLPMGEMIAAWLAYDVFTWIAGAHPGRERLLDAGLRGRGRQGLGW
jgi:hypothetical protein